MELGKHPLDIMIDDPDEPDDQPMTMQELVDGMAAAMHDWNETNPGDAVPASRAFLEALARTVLDHLNADDDIVTE